MRLILALVAVTSLACGELATGGSGSSKAPSASSAPSAFAAAVLPLIAGLRFQAYALDGLATDLHVEPSLVGSSALGARGMGDPVLAVWVSQTAGTKPWLRVLEGPSGCCPLLSSAPTREVTLRPTSGSARPLVAQLYPPSSASEGPTLRWHETSTSGEETEILLSSTTFGPYAEERALVDLARQMRPLPRVNAAGVVHLYVSTHISHSPTGHRVYLAVRSAPVPDQARLIDPRGGQVAVATFAAPRSYDCLASAAGQAAFPVDHDVAAAFGSGIAGGYRAEVLVRGQWRSAQLVASSCSSVE